MMIKRATGRIQETSTEIDEAMHLVNPVKSELEDETTFTMPEVKVKEEENGK